MRDVLVVGAGAAGLALAARLLEAGLDVAVWERRPSPAALSRAIGIHAPALEALPTEVSERITAEAVLVRHGIARTRRRVLGVVPFDRVSTRFPFVATLPQARTEEILAARVAALDPAAVRRGVSLTSLVQGREAVSVTGTVPGDGDGDGDGGDGGSIEETARFVVAADGARSPVRELLGITAPVHHHPDTYVMGDFPDDGDAGPDAVIHLEHAGVVESFPLPGGLRRWVVHTPDLVTGPSADLVAGLVAERTGIHVDATDARMLSAFAVRRRLAARTVRGRVVLLGDAAHEISPIGGQGMNLGWLDGARLAPILVAAVRSSGADDAAPALASWDATRRRRARWAARQGELNMALGRPVGGASALARDALLVAALRSPARRGLAYVYAMRHLR
ncbi:FAD-dependent monooxygenase [Serinibacter arcticus]|uniref:FAD-dependent monooxygenase n=1 Tax=Serinibacter arcticus TaxID=1655435 RepID=A0A2U1ZZE6_9MICO|nr:FAD-dependent monooxygenase [Serinibacter arcticus]